MKYIVEVDDWGNQEWRNKNGILHREDGPAIIGPDGYKIWYFEGEYLTEAAWRERINN